MKWLTDAELDQRISDLKDLPRPDAFGYRELMGRIAILEELKLARAVVKHMTSDWLFCDEMKQAKDAYDQAKEMAGG